MREGLLAVLPAFMFIVFYVTQMSTEENLH